MAHVEFHTTNLNFVILLLKVPNFPNFNLLNFLNHLFWTSACAAMTRGFGSRRMVEYTEPGFVTKTTNASSGTPLHISDISRSPVEATIQKESNMNLVRGGAPMW